MSNKWVFCLKQLDWKAGGFIFLSSQIMWSRNIWGSIYSFYVVHKASSFPRNGFLPNEKEVAYAQYLQDTVSQHIVRKTIIAVTNSDSLCTSE